MYNMVELVTDTSKKSFHHLLFGEIDLTESKGHDPRDALRTLDLYITISMPKH